MNIYESQTLKTVLIVYGGNDNDSRRAQGFGQFTDIPGFEEGCIYT